MRDYIKYYLTIYDEYDAIIKQWEDSGFIDDRLEGELKITCAFNFHRATKLLLRQVTDNINSHLVIDEVNDNVLTILYPIIRRLTCNDDRRFIKGKAFSEEEIQEIIRLLDTTTFEHYFSVMTGEEFKTLSCLMNHPKDTFTYHNIQESEYKCDLEAYLCCIFCEYYKHFYMRI